MFSYETSLVIPTRNRPEYLKKTLDQINKSNIKFLEIIVVDSSDDDIKQKIYEFIKLFNVRFFNSEASTSIQRNIGIKNINDQSKFIMFLDDDIIFKENMFEFMDQTILSNLDNQNIVGYGFNQIQEIEGKNILENIKNNFVFNFLELYPNQPGKVALSGWQSKILNIKKDTYVDWIYTTACIYKTKDIKNLKFAEDFGKYGYLEDLDFSLNFLHSNKKIIISANAKYLHPLSIDRSSFQFGLYEVRNRFKIVKKYKLSKFRFFIMTLLRMSIFFLNILLLNKNKFYRALGNFFAIMNCFKY